MTTMSNKLSTWLAKELNKRSWSARELARRIDMSQTSISRYLEGSLTPSPKTCLKIATAFGIPDSREIMRLAGHLPPLPDPVAEEQEAIIILRSLSEDARVTVMRMLRGLTDSYAIPIKPATSIVLTEPLPSYQTLDAQIAPLVEQYPDLGPLFDEAKRDLPDHAVQALIYNVQIWIEGEDKKENFADLHHRLSDFLTRLESSSSERDGRGGQMGKEATKSETKRLHTTDHR